MESKDISKMTLKEVHGFIIDRRDAGQPLTQQEKIEIHDLLGNYIAYAGTLWDLADGTDPRKGSTVQYGTPNRRSMTYKCRKLAGYSYP